MKKIITILLVLSLMLCCAACGQTEDPKNTSAPAQTPEAKPDPTGVALIINEHQITGVEMYYYFLDSISQWYGTYGSYASMFGLDLRKPLDEQFYDVETGETWADCFLDMAVKSAQSTYALFDEAQKAGYTMPEEEAADLKEMYDSMDKYATEAKYDSAEDYLKELYGDSADMQSYKAYYDTLALASSYYSHHAKTLLESYTDEDLRKHEGDTPYEYDSFTYASFYLPLDQFKIGGTKGENGKITYSDAELAAAEKYLVKVAGQLSADSINTIEKLNAAIASMEDQLAKDKGEDVEKVKHSTATQNKELMYSKISSTMQEWLRDESRVNGDITAIPYEISTAIEEDDKDAEKVLQGYYIVLFQDRTDNIFPLVNVRHILAAFKGGTYNSSTGQTVYTDAEKKAAKEEAEKLLKQWQDGEATEESFATLANKHSADGDGTTGGLYEDIYPGQMVTNFNDWCFDDSRKPGDTGIVESPYGYHVMFFVSDSDQTYRDFMVSNEMLTEDMNKWQTALNDAVALEKKDMSLVDTGRVIA